MTNREPSNKKSDGGISRRLFIGAAAGSAIVGVAAGFAGGYLSAPSAPKIADNLILKIPTTWDSTADVVVIGSGGAGLSAAVGAIESGATVIILEKASSAGGTTAVSGGGMWVPNNSLATAAGVTQSTSDILTYLTNTGGGQENMDLINTYLQEGPTWIDHFMSITGVSLTINKTFNVYYNVPGQLPSPGWGFQVSPSAGGSGITKALITWLNNKNVQVTTSTPAVALYKDATGTIVGVQASSNGTAMNIAATKGVVLAAGGFDNNPPMMGAYLRGPTTLTSAVIGNTGDGILMAQAAGAQIANMNNTWGCPHYSTPDGGIPDWCLIRGKPGAIIVNQAGNRFADESSAYAVMNRSFYAWDTKIYGYPNLPAFTIIDSTFNTKYGFVSYIPGSTPASYVSSGDTLQDLATTLGIDPNGLAATVTQFNQYAANGIDPDFNRGVSVFDLNTAGDPTRTDLKNICLGPIETPPFYGLQIQAGTIGTCGGPVINSSGQVLDQAGNPIPRLYAAGNDSASPFGASYPNGGATVGAGTIFGWIAGKAAGSS